MKKRVKIYLGLTALLLIVLGVLCMVNPGHGLLSVAWLIGLLILLTGVLSLVFGLRAQAFLPNAGSTTLLAILQIFIGILFLANKFVGAATLSIVFAFWVTFEGISLGVLSIDYKRAGYNRWWLMLLLGLCSVVLGIAALCRPASSGVALGILIGLGIMANGVVRLVALSAIRRIEGRVQDVKDKLRSVNIDALNSEK